MIVEARQNVDRSIWADVYRVTIDTASGVFTIIEDPLNGTVSLSTNDGVLVIRPRASNQVELREGK